MPSLSRPRAETAGEAKPLWFLVCDDVEGGGGERSVLGVRCLHVRE